MADFFTQADTLDTTSSEDRGASRAMGYGSLADDRQYEVQRGNHFTVIFGPASSKDAKASDDVWIKTIEMAVEGLSLPNITVDAMSLSRGNQTYKVAGKVQIEFGELTLRDFITADTEAMLMNWFSKVYNPQTAQIGFAADYKRQARLIEYSPDGSVARNWKLEGCWPSTMTSGALSSDNSEKKQVTCQVQVDNAYPIDLSGNLRISSSTSPVNPLVNNLIRIPSGGALNV